MIDKLFKIVQRGWTNKQPLTFYFRNNPEPLCGIVVAFGRSKCLNQFDEVLVKIITDPDTYPFNLGTENTNTKIKLILLEEVEKIDNF